MNEKEQVEVLMNELMGFAEKMLSEHGEFHPFGGYVRPTGEIVHVGVDDGKAQQKIDELVESFRRLAARGEGVAFGIAVDVMLPNSKDGKGDAIKFSLEHQDGYCAEVFFRYTVPAEGGVEITETIAQKGVSLFFAPTH